MSVKLHTIGLVVKDMAKTLNFYRSLGLNIPPGEENSPHVEFEDTHGYVLGFDTEEIVRRNDPKWTGATGAQRINLQFEYPTPAEVDAVHGKLIAEGAGEYMAPWDAFWGQRFARICDPDGNVVNLFSELPR